jgi:hypothetical protein
MIKSSICSFEILGIQIIWVIFPPIANPRLSISFYEVLGKTTVGIIKEITEFDLK